MGTLEQTEPPIVDAIGRFVPPTAGIELRIAGLGWQRLPVRAGLTWLPSTG